MKLIAEIIHYLKKIVDQPETDISPDTSLIHSGLLDSLKIISVIAYIEERFKVSLAGYELVVDNFETPEAIAKFVNERIRGNE